MLSLPVVGVARESRRATWHAASVRAAVTRVLSELLLSLEAPEPRRGVREQKTIWLLGTTDTMAVGQDGLSAVGVGGGLGEDSCWPGAWGALGGKCIVPCMGEA